jgi:hypothetical protein
MVISWDSVICFGLRLKAKRIVLLILKRCETEEAYERVGLVRDMNNAWFEQYATEGTVTIV